MQYKIIFNKEEIIILYRLLCDYYTYENMHNDNMLYLYSFLNKSKFPNNLVIIVDNDELIEMYNIIKSYKNWSYMRFTEIKNFINEFLEMVSYIKYQLLYQDVMKYEYYYEDVPF